MPHNRVLPVLDTRDKVDHEVPSGDQPLANSIRDASSSRLYVESARLKRSYRSKLCRFQRGLSGTWTCLPFECCPCNPIRCSRKSVKTESTLLQTVTQTSRLIQPALQPAGSTQRSRRWPVAGRRPRRTIATTSAASGVPRALVPSRAAQHDAQRPSNV